MQVCSQMCKWAPCNSSSFTVLFHLPVKFNPHLNCNIQQSAFCRLIFLFFFFSFFISFFLSFFSFLFSFFLGGGGATSFPAKSYNFSVMGVFVGFPSSIARTCLQRGATICSKQGYNFELTLLAPSTCQIRMSACVGKPMLCLLMIFALRMLLCLRWAIRYSTV